MTHPKTLSKENSLLVVIDVQEKLSAVMKHRQQIIDNISKMIKGCEALNVPILLTEQYPKGLGKTEADILNTFGAGIEPYQKMCFSCWGESEFMAEVKESGKKQIVLTGIETHVCVYQTAMDLLAEGYEVYVMQDCVASRHKHNWKAGLDRMKEMGGHIYTVEMALFELLVRADIPEFKVISRLVK